MENPNSQTMKNSNSQIMKNSNSQIMKNSNSQIMKNQNSQTMKNQNSQTHVKCNHFFVFGEKKESPSCTGTHYSHCKFCHLNPHQYVCDLIVDLHDKGITKGMNERDKQELYHVHVWEPVVGMPGVYKCLSDVTDWIRSTENFCLRVPCNELITVDH